MSPLEFFIRKQTTSGILLICFSLIAFGLANSAWNNALIDIGLIQLGIVADNWKFTLSINDWISQGLMTLFFFLTGLELKREIIAGKLRDYKEIRMICMAAVGGILVPASVYLAVNVGSTGQHGWGIPTATDTAFSIAILSLFARTIPAGVIIFLTALAIFDDIGAIVIISLFYAHTMNTVALGTAAIILFVLFLANSAGVRQGWFYLVAGILLWFCIKETGIHPTLSGLLLAMTIPARTSISQSLFIKNIKGLLSRFEQKQESSSSMLGSSNKHALVADMGENVWAASTPLQRWELGLIIPISIIILPIFALFNAGIPITSDLLIRGLQSPVTSGIVLGLVIGKPVGILLFVLAAIKLRIGRLPQGVHIGDIVGVAMLAGIGFTMSVFFATLSFPESSDLIELAKLGILVASVLSALFGSLWIYLRSMTKNG